MRSEPKPFGHHVAGVLLQSAWILGLMVTVIAVFAAVLAVVFGLVSLWMFTPWWLAGAVTLLVASLVVGTLTYFMPPIGPRNR